MRLFTRLATPFLGALLLAASPAIAGSDTGVTLEIQASQPGPVISRDIFGQFAEHLGEGIYGGVWVGPGSPIPNVRGIRSDVVQALRALKVPNVRWPGGCFADLYNWRDGVGPAASRRATLNANWGSVVEPNTFGTHEFMDFVEQIGSEAFIVVNVGSGSAREASDWLEYMTTDQPSALGRAREANGRTQPWRVKYVGIGNESWSCGGNMTPANYVQHLKTYTTFLQSFHPDQARPIKWVRGPGAIQRIAVGPEAAHTEYTEAVMQAWKDSKPWSWGFEGIDLHFYAMGPKPLQSPATGFSAADYASFVKETRSLEGIIARHTAIMDRHDPQRKVALVVGEWGAWLAPMAGTNPNFLKQQNSMRDAVLASLNLNIFVRQAERVRVANVAQMVNVLQAMILTDGSKMVLTPTYHVFRLYVPFQDAQRVPVTLDAGEYRVGDIAVPRVDAIAARGANGKIWLAMTNIDPEHPVEFDAVIRGMRVRQASGETLTASRIDAVNSFDNPRAVTPVPVTFRGHGGSLPVRLPPRSITVVQLRE